MKLLRCGMAAVAALLWALAGCAEVCAVDDDDTWIEATGSIPFSSDGKEFPITLTYHVADEPPGFVASISGTGCEPAASSDTCELDASGLTAKVHARHWLDSSEAQDYDNPVTVFLAATGADGSPLVRSEHDVALTGEPGSSTCPNSRTGYFSF